MSRAHHDQNKPAPRADSKKRDTRKRERERLSLVESLARRPRKQAACVLSLLLSAIKFRALGSRVSDVTVSSGRGFTRQGRAAITSNHPRPSDVVNPRAVLNFSYVRLTSYSSFISSSSSIRFSPELSSRLRSRVLGRILLF